MNSVFTEAVSFGIVGGVTGQLLEGKPLPYAVALGTFSAFSSVITHSTKGKEKTIYPSLLQGGALVFTAAFVAKLGLTTLTLNPPLLLLATGACIVNVYVNHYGKFENIELPGTVKNISVMRLDCAVLAGATLGVTEACVFGWNPVTFGTMIAIRSLVTNLSFRYPISYCVRITTPPGVEMLAVRITGTVLAVGLLQMNLAYVGGAVAVIALSKFFSDRLLPKGA